MSLFLLPVGVVGVSDIGSAAGMASAPGIALGGYSEEHAAQFADTSGFAHLHPRVIEDGELFASALSAITAHPAGISVDQGQEIDFHGRYPVYDDRPLARSGPSIKEVMTACYRKGCLLKIKPEFFMSVDESITEEDIGEILSRILAVVQAMPGKINTDPNCQLMIEVTIDRSALDHPQKTIVQPDVRIIRLNTQKPFEAGKILLREIARHRFIERGQDSIPSLREALTSFLKEICPGAEEADINGIVNRENIIYDLVAETAVSGSVERFILSEALGLRIEEVGAGKLRVAARKLNRAVRNIVKSLLFTHTTPEGQQRIIWPRIREGKLTFVLS